MFDFGVGYSELLVLALIAVLVIGPKDLPKVLRTFGQFMRKMRGMAKEFQGHVDSAMRDSGINELKREAKGLNEGFKSSLSMPSLGSAAASQSRATNDFTTYFGASPEPGETRVAGEKIAVAPAPTAS
jgi:sec-independent protein translocase protein TatB